MSKLVNLSVSSPQSHTQMLCFQSSLIERLLFKYIFDKSLLEKKKVDWLLCRLIEVWIVKNTLLKTRLLSFWMKVHLVKCDRF